MKKVIVLLATAIAIGAAFAHASVESVTSSKASAMSRLQAAEAAAQ